jgi:fatty-acyl-CoA synthase
LPNLTRWWIRVAGGLAGMGVGHATRVGVLARNSHGFAALRFALARLGAVLVPINFMLKADEVAYILRHAQVQTLATDSGPGRSGPRNAAALDTAGEGFHLAAVGRPERARAWHDDV